VLKRIAQGLSSAWSEEAQTSSRGGSRVDHLPRLGRDPASTTLIAHAWRSREREAQVAEESSRARRSERSSENRIDLALPHSDFITWRVGLRGPIRSVKGSLVWVPGTTAALESRRGVIT